MDNNMKTVERTTLRDFIETFRGFFSTTNSNTEEVEDKLQKVYQVEKEIGATGEIEKLEQTLNSESLTKSKKKKNMSLKKDNKSSLVINKGVNGKNINSKDIETVDEQSKDIEISD